ncbi:MAG: formyltetrahydrofolate deformylase [Chlorobium sp.]|jgi:formyltetrahydrofolate deformylase|uniref:formyltetrahydrofolate deformylase n=1 Tax=Chlorobium sp. TaxID=1095 RepID=UPI001D433826|nr:formyltetrahydrofolate deformylase [Chlorobium sp.]MBN1279665.1 formyltetrahydrofolate deformylase [Chlorobiaceae bacterium]MCF8215919.1 formyltetrahydrofolate deformylase [Chlorobium sp.]MCF8270817.1 formyltetrahydrofolate deformylase [Chlorobium sp.]MCF8287129.1 formyltetrahydrofolate deformylase [Chlorobium sp.]MCF8290786.1 formyltetrahydrofolate deformylase [Chlorobium sp.]
MSFSDSRAILLLSCPDRVGLVSRISHFIYERGGNILDLDEHVDTVEKTFFIRVSWSTAHFSIPASELHDAFSPLAREFGANWHISLGDCRMRVAMFVSKYDHCLQDLLWRHSTGEFAVDIPLIVSNHPDLEPLAARYGIPFHVFPLTAETRHEVERQELELLQLHDIDTVVLARYMQILSPQFVECYPAKVINIHHSFLPAFVGSSPYRQAAERGVKIIGATSHYVTEDLDQGPIIEQDIVRITHKDTLDDLIRKGRDLERLVLARALRLHSEQRILVNGKKTVVFD